MQLQINYFANKVSEAELFQKVMQQLSSLYIYSRKSILENTKSCVIAIRMYNFIVNIISVKVLGFKSLALLNICKLGVTTSAT